MAPVRNRYASSSSFAASSSRGSSGWLRAAGSGATLVQLGERRGVTFELILAEELRRRMRLFVRQWIGWVSQRR